MSWQTSKIETGHDFMFPPMDSKKDPFALIKNEVETQVPDCVAKNLKDQFGGLSEDEESEMI